MEQYLNVDSAFDQLYMDEEVVHDQQGKHWDEYELESNSVSRSPTPLVRRDR